MITPDKYLAMSEEEKANVHPIDVHVGCLHSLAQTMDDAKATQDVMRFIKAVEALNLVNIEMQKVAQRMAAVLMAAGSKNPPAKA